MGPLLFVCLMGATGIGADADFGYVHPPAFEIEADPQATVKPYRPQAGDMFFSTDNLAIIRWGHRVSGAHAPHHSGVIFVQPNGHWCTLEAGPHNTLRVRVLDMNYSLSSYERKSCKVWVRQRSVPTTPTQSKKLAEFAMAQDGKPFALARMLGQLTPFRTRGPNVEFAAGPQTDKPNFWCAELLTTACAASGLLEPANLRPSATYPSDLFYGKSPVAFIDKNLHVNEAWLPPARWTAHPQGVHAASQATSRPPFWATFP